MGFFQTYTTSLQDELFFDKFLTVEGDILSKCNILWAKFRVLLLNVLHRIVTQLEDTILTSQESPGNGRCDERRGQDRLVGSNFPEDTRG